MRFHYELVGTDEWGNEVTEDRFDFIADAIAAREEAEADTGNNYWLDMRYGPAEERGERVSA